MRRPAAVFVLMTSLFFFFAGWVFADEFDNVTAAIERGDDNTALRLIKQLAEQGNAKAQLLLGTMYEVGKHVPRDAAVATKWIRKAADQGLAEAQCMLGVNYWAGQGVQQNDAEAANWFRRSAEQGYFLGQYYLGQMYATGKGVPEDPVQSLMWLDLSALRLPFDAANLPVEEGNKESPKMKDMIDFFRASIAEFMTPEQIAEAQRLAREWKPKKEK